MPVTHKILIRTIAALCVCSFLACSIAASQPHAKGGYQLIKKIPIGGDGGWDYLYMDSGARKLYVSHSSHVVVLDADSGKIVGDLPNTNGVHGIAVAPELGRGFTSNGKDSTVMIFDTKSLAVIGSVKVEKNPDALIYDPVTARVFAFNRGSSSVSAVDAASGKVVGTLALDGHPEFSVSDGKGMMYVNLDNKSEVVAFDAKTMTIKGRYPVAPGEDPSGMAMDRESRRLFVVCGNKMMVVLNADNGKVVSTIATGDGTDAAAFDPGTKLAFSSNGEGTMTVVKEESPDKFVRVESVPTRQGARTMTVDPKTHHVFLATAEFGPAPAATAEHPHPRPAMIPGSFVVLEFGPK
jgi:DNA-binding beta-propeller fold protein YncE